MAVLSLWSAIGAAADSVVPSDESTTGQNLTIASMPIASDRASSADTVTATTSGSAAAEPLRASQADGSGGVSEAYADGSEYISPSRSYRLAPENLAPTRYNKSIDRGDID
jgi:hypothetical protein